jgi:hypothetical protein
MKFKSSEAYLKLDRPTDKLLLTGKWYEVDVKLNVQINAFKDADVFRANKENNVVQNFINHSEKLFDKNGVDFGYSNIDEKKLIQELRDKLQNYEQWRVAAQTLRLAILAFRSGKLSEIKEIAIYEKRKQSRKGRKPKTVNGITPEMRAIRDKKIIENFKKSKLSANNFANKNAVKYKKEYDISPRRVRDILSKEVGS